MPCISNNYKIEKLVENILEDREILLKCVKNYGISIKYAKDYFKNDQEIVYHAIQNNGLSIE